MKKREPAGEGRNRRQKIRPLAAFLLAAALVATAVQIPGVAAKADTFDPKTPCSLKVIPSADEGYASDLEGSVAIDLYQVADAVKVSGHTYNYKVKEGYSDLEESLSVNNLQNMKAGDWRNLAQKAAGIAMGDGSGATGKTPDVTGAKTNTSITTYSGENAEQLKPGLYLIVARPVDADPGIYTKREVKGSEGTESQESQADSEIVTEISTVRYTYSFSPELISLPNKKPDENGNLNTANPGGWLYDVTAMLKPSREERKGSLAITKTLASQSPLQRPATFVFRVEAYLDRENGEELVYSDVVGMTFTGVGNQKVTLADKIPVGSRVVVTEVYSGASYEISGDSKQEGTLEAADTLLSMTFTNRGGNDHRDGSGVVNNFTYSGAEGDAEGGWQWNQNPGGTE